MSHWEFPEEAAVAYEDLTVTNVSAKGLNVPINPTTGLLATQAFVQCQKATARLRLDGGTPTANSGFMLVAGDGMVMRYDRVSQARFIADTNTAALLSVHYF